MTAAAKLSLFAGLLALAFGAAALAGSAFGPEPDASADETPRADGDGHGGAEAGGAPEGEADHGGEGGETAGEGGHGGDAEPNPVRGLAVSDAGLTLELDRTELPRGRETEIAFTIVGRDGRALRDFEVEHEKRMHLIVVRRDGTGFQHLHPEMDSSGRWSTRLTIPDAGAYRVFADFSDGEARTLAADLAVDGDASYRPLPDPVTTAEVDGYEVSLDAGEVHPGEESELRFEVTRDGRKVETEPYLGAGGHLVALREGDLAYLHVHPGEELSFMSELPSAGRYRLFLQFKHDGAVHTAAFTLEVPR
jgi:hypothetical protein